VTTGSAAGLIPGPLARWRGPRGLGAADAAQDIGPFIRRRLLDAALLLVPVAAGVLAGVKIKYAIMLVVAIAIIGLGIAKPVIAAYSLILLTPLVVGLSVVAIPLLRPNEALIVLFGMALGLRWLAGVRTGGLRWPRIDWVDITLVALGVTSSVVPLVMMVARQRTISKDDLLYCIVVWKLLAEYVIVRTVVKTREQAKRCLVLSLVAAGIVCGIGVVQALAPAHVAGFLAKFYNPGGITGNASAGNLTNGRGSSLLGLPAAVADLAILNLGIAIAMIMRGYPHRRLLAGLAVLFAMGVLAAAEFSTWIGLLVAFIALLVLTKSTRLATYSIPVAVIGGVFLWPVISIRLSGFHSASGLPTSWLDRLYNLQTYFWPTLFSDNNWILGVEPSARVALDSKQFGYVWIESGYTWLLWGGGIPLLASYLAFVGVVLRKCWKYARRPGPAGIAATAIAALICSQVVLMIFDPHLTYRGSGDALFLTLALVRSLPGRRDAANDETGLADRQR
jgi:hypothetical protein